MRRPLLIAVPVLVVLAVLGFVGLRVLDHRADAKIAKGIRVGGVDVGGLSPPQARERLRARLLEPLGTPVVVRRGDRLWRLTGKQAKVAANVGGMVDAALTRSREGNAFSHAMRELRGGTVQASLPARVTYSRSAVRALLARIETAVNRPAKDASVSFSGSGVTKLDGHDGLALEAGTLEDRIAHALRHAKADRSFTASVRRVHPKVTTSELAAKYPVALAIDRAHFTLRLFKNLKLDKSYPIAVGQAGLETPAGLYHITNKAVNPAWHVPNSAWAGSLAGQVIPGGAPNNPIKARWLGVYDGVGVHGTSEDSSIGSAASHGCIRMHISDVEDLYPRVPVSSPIYIG